MDLGVSNIVSFLIGTAIGAAGCYFLAKYTDKRANNDQVSSTTEDNPQAEQNPAAELDPKLYEYRQSLYEVQVKLGESYDKLIITLSGGALALSITFLKDIIKVDSIVYSWLLLSAWGLFILSLACILGEILFGIKAFKKAIKQIDDGTIYDKPVGGSSSKATNKLHISASLTLIAGLILISVFVYFNMGEGHDKTKTKPETTITTPKAEINSNPGTDSTKTGLP